MVIARDSFKFQKRRQLFIRSHNETLSVVAVCVCNPDCSPVGINRWDAAPTPTDFDNSVIDRRAATWVALYSSGARQLFFSFNWRVSTQTQQISWDFMLDRSLALRLKTQTVGCLG
jgi:hypothetical protein